MLTTDKSFCYHELFADCCSNVADMKKYFIDSGKSIVGNSDSGNIIIIVDILKVFPEAKIVIVKRNRTEASKSLVQWHHDLGLGQYTTNSLTNTLDKFYDNIDVIEKTTPCLSINYEDLASVETCKKIFDYCTGLPFDTKRFELLKNLDIQGEKKHQLKKINNLISSGEIKNLIS
jgi:hypothetical protein